MNSANLWLLGILLVFLSVKDIYCGVCFCFFLVEYFLLFLLGGAFDLLFHHFTCDFVNPVDGAILFKGRKLHLNPGVNRLIGLVGRVFANGHTKDFKNGT